MLRSPLVRAQLKHLCTKNCILKERAVAPSSTCPNWTFSTANTDVATWEGIFLPPIQKRINRILSPVQLTTSEVCIICISFSTRLEQAPSHQRKQVLGGLYACAYELAAYGNTTWCSVFQENEFLDFEYM